jgi:glycosyl transferase family 87
MRWRRRGRVAVLAALFDLSLFNAYQVFRSDVRWPDFAFFYAFARSALSDGYTHLYEPSSQRYWDQLLFPGSPYYPVVNPPPFVWVLAPLAMMPFGLALLVWTVGMIAAIAAASQIASPPGRFGRVLYLGSWLGFLPAYLVFVSAPLGPLVVLSLVLAWKWLREDRQGAAGLVLSVGLLKPTLAILVPVALLAAGYRRAFITWAVAAAVAVAASSAVLGPEGIRTFLGLSRYFAEGDYFLRWSLVPIIGDGVGWFGAAASITAAIVGLAWRTRRQGLEATISIGVTGSVLINHHMTPGDLMVLLVPIWLLLRVRRAPLRDGLLGLAWGAGWASIIVPTLALVVAVGVPLALFAETMQKERAALPGGRSIAGEAVR